MQVVLGTLLASLVPVVGFNAVMTSEHFASFLVRLANQFFYLLEYYCMIGCIIFFAIMLIFLFLFLICSNLSINYLCHMRLHVTF